MMKISESSPLEGIELDCGIERLSDVIQRNQPIVYIADKNIFKRESINYNNLPHLIKWFQDVYDYCTELKNQINYVDFNFAKMHMLNGDKAMFENETYYIKYGELYCEELNSACALKLRAIESDKWTLL